MAHDRANRVANGDSRDAVGVGGPDGVGGSRSAIVDPGPATKHTLGGVVAGPRSVSPTGSAESRWPDWAGSQLDEAAALAAAAPAESRLAALLYRKWFTPPVATADLRWIRRPLAGVYRSAHAGSGQCRLAFDVVTIARHDVIAPNGWWRTWGEAWTPPRTRPGSVRVLFSPRPQRLADFVAVTTHALLGASIPWSLGCATEPRRILRAGAAVLDLPDLDAMPTGLLDELAPLLAPAAPPLCLPLVSGAAAAYYPDNGMTFGEHRCHLVALGLRHARSTDREPLHAIGRVFAAHGIDPAAPYRSR
ncbi:MAG TPA: T3SS effector HopA1 family protein [Jatrophihabitans sp.]|nr:T3SS effector HopA1 family protein [Jatrophihabitans sp.]